jgi:hypothetical protein
VNSLLVEALRQRLKRPDADDGAQVLTTAEIAAEVIRCGQMRRGELDVPFEAPVQPRSTPLSAAEAHSIAQQIVAAGKRRRGEAE